VVPWNSKDLKLIYASFRDKTLPGSEEIWKIKISGNKNEKVAAEMLASMYMLHWISFIRIIGVNLPIWPILVTIIAAGKEQEIFLR
jgi:hypothetical protein